MSLMRYEPMGLLEHVRREMERMYGDRGAGDEGHIATASDWVPAVDIKEEQDSFVIRADLPGVDPKNIEARRRGHADHPRRARERKEG